MNTSSKKVHEGAVECCKLANQRYGLSEGMKILMNSLNMNDHAKNLAVELAKNREFDDLKTFIKNINTIESGKPRFILIKRD